MDALAPEGKVYVCPEPICQQHFHQSTTKGAVLEHLLCHAHTDFSYHKNENVCPFWCQKGFHDLDLLKQHLREQQCVFAKEFDDLASDLEKHIGAQNKDKHSDTSSFACYP